MKLKESEMKHKYVDIVRELKKKTIEHEGDNCTNRDWCFWYSNKRISKGTGGPRGWRTSRNHPNYSIIENGQNTEKCPGDLKRLSVTKTPVKNHQLKLLARIIKGPGGFRSWPPSGDHPNNSITEDGQSTEKNPRDVRRLAVNQSPVKDHQLTLMWKTLMNKQ